MLMGRHCDGQFNDALPEEFAKVDIYPEALRAEIDAQNDYVYPTVNNGVYRSGSVLSTSLPAAIGLVRLSLVVVRRDGVGSRPRRKPTRRP